MNKDAEQLMAKALEIVKLNGYFSPSEIGARIGLSKMQAEIAARSLANAGVLVLGFDSAAHFSPDFRKIHAPVERNASAKKSPRAKKKVAAKAAV